MEESEYIEYEELTDKKYYPTLPQSWMIALYLIIIQIVVSFLLSILGLNAFVLTDLLSFVILLYIIFGKKKKVHDFPVVKYKKSVPILLYIILIPTVIGLNIVIEFIGDILLPEVPEWLEKFIENLIKKEGAFSMALSAVVIAPIFEEIVCRGIICEGLLNNMKPYKAILWSSFIFAVIHMNPWQGLSAFIIGSFLGWIYWKTRSVIPCIFIHFVNNGFLILLMAIFGEDIGSSKGFNALLGYSETEYVCSGIILFILGFFIVKRILNKDYSIENS